MSRPSSLGEFVCGGADAGPGTRQAAPILAAVRTASSCTVSPKLTCNRIDIRAGRYADLVAQAPRQHRLMQHRCRGDRRPTSGLRLALNAPEAVKQCDRVLIGVRHAHQITSADASAGATGRTACGSSDAASPLAWDTRGRIRGGKQNLSPRSGRGYDGDCPREIVVAIGEPPARHRIRLGNLQKAGVHDAGRRFGIGSRQGLARSLLPCVRSIPGGVGRHDRHLRNRAWLAGSAGRAGPRRRRPCRIPCSGGGSMHRPRRPHVRRAVSHGTIRAYRRAGRNSRGAQWLGQVLQRRQGLRLRRSGRRETACSTIRMKPAGG